MKIQSLQVNQANITFVWDKLDFDNISRDKMRKIVPDKKSIIAELPDALILNYNDSNINASFQGRKLYVNVPNQVNKDIEENFNILCNLADGLYYSVYEANLIAFGINFDGEAVFGGEGSIHQFFISNFVKDYKSFGEKLDGEITSVSPKFGLKKNGLLYNISFDPIFEEEKKFIFHLNIHFAKNNFKEYRLLVDNLKAFYEELIQIFEQF